MKAQLLAWWIARRPRERLLAIAAALALLAAGVDALLFAPLRAQQSAASQALKAAREQLQQMQRVVDEHAQEGDARLRERTASLAARRERAQKIIREAQVDLIAPQDMGRQLAAILARFPELRVVGMSSSPPAPVGDGGGGTVTGLYQHGIEIQVEGRYLALIAYLEALEKAPYRIYWRELDMKVNPQGTPVTRVAFYTLSREAVWLRI